MSFTLISGFIIILTLSAVIVNAVKGYTRGLYKASMRLAKIFIATMGAILISFLVSNIVVNMAFDIVEDIDIYQEIIADLPSVELIIKAYIDAVITPLFFVVLFGLCYLAVNIITAIVYKIKYKSKIKHVQYEREDAPWFIKKSKPLGMVVGAFTGLFVTSIVIAALFGTLRLTVKTADTINNNPTISKSVKINEKFVNELRRYSTDAPATIVYHCGGNLVYKMSAVSSLNGNRFSIEKEVKGMETALNDAVEVLPVLNSLDTITAEQKQSVLALPSDIDDSETLKSLSSDFVSGASSRWLEGEKFMNMSMPKVGNVIEPIVGNILYVCKSTTPETSSEDIKTLLRVYIIISENKLLESGNYEELILHFSENDVINEICDVLEENDRMRGIAKAVRNVTMNTVASAINSFKYDIAQYDMLMTNLAASLNELDGLTTEQKVDAMTNNAMQYINDYGIEMPESVARVTAEQMINELSDENGDVTPQRLQVLFDSYALTETAE